MVLDFLKGKQERIEDIESDIKKLRTDIDKEKEWSAAVKKKSDYLEQQKLMRRQLFDERDRLKKDMQEYKQSHSRLGRLKKVVGEKEKAAMAYLASPKGKAVLKKLDRFFR